MNSTEQRELVLKIFKDDQYEELREIIKTECFEDIFNYINEHNIDLTPFLDQLPDEWIYHVGRSWSSITDEQRCTRFDKLKEEEETFLLELLDISSELIVDYMSDLIFDKQDKVREFYGEDVSSLDG